MLLDACKRFRELGVENYTNFDLRKFTRKKKFVRFVFIPKKYFLSELRKKLGHNFDVENCKLSIGKVFRAIPALCREVGQFKCNTMNSPKIEQTISKFQNLAEFRKSSKNCSEVISESELGIME